jgi:hypothetical protein
LILFNLLSTPFIAPQARNSPYGRYFAPLLDARFSVGGFILFRRAIMTKFIPLFLVLAASLAFSGSNARASDFGVSVGIGNGGYYSPYYDDGYVTYYDNSGYYPYSYDDYGYYYPSYNWNTNVGWYGSWYGNHDRDRDYWRGSYGNNYRYNNTYRNTNNYNTGYRSGSSVNRSTGTRSSGTVRSGGGGHRR